MKIVAVVFDMDGVLFDTERIGVQSWTEAAEPTGLQNAYEIARMCIGRTIPGTKEVFMAEAEKQGIVLDFEKLHADCSRRIFEKEERDGLPEKPGVHEILEYLHEKKIPVALASSSKKATVLSHLEKSGITGYFQKIVTLTESDRLPRQDYIRSWYRISCSLPRRSCCWQRQSVTVYWM